MKFSPKFTVVTIVFNAKEILEKTICSVTEQTYANVEYIIIDGGSTDGTMEIVKLHVPSIHKWISEPDKGIYDAMNKALSMANGDFLIFMNAGDIFYSAYTIEEIANKVECNDFVYYGDAVKVKNEIETGSYKGYFNKFRLTHENICHQAIFYPRKVYKNIDFELRYPVLADWIYNIRAYGITNFEYISKNICYYDTEGFSNHKIDEQAMREAPAIIRMNLGFNAWVFFHFRKFFRAVSKRIYLLTLFQKVKLKLKNK